jgi:hypothetical protein
MIAWTSTSTIVLGAAMAYLASADVRYQAAMETVAGFLLLGGFGLLGYGLKCALGQP